MNYQRNQKQVVLDQLINPRPQQQIQRKRNQKQILELIKRKDNQILILHQVNSRLGMELGALQRKLGIDHDLILRQLENIGQISVAFHYQTEQLQYLDNLLKAYDQNSLRQKKLIALLYSQLEDAQKKSQNLVKENQFLLNQMQEKCKQILQIYNKGFPQDNLVSAYNKLQIQSQNQRMTTIKQENQYLLDNYHQLQIKYQKVVDQVQQSRKIAEKYFQNFRNQTQQLKDSLIKIDDLVKIKDVLQKKFDQVTQQNIQLQTQKNQLENKINRIQNDYKSVKNQNLSSKKNHREQIEKLNGQIQTMKMELQTCQKKQRQTLHKQMSMQRQLELTKDNFRKIKRDLQKKSSDQQTTVKMLQAYQTKLNHYSKKEQSMKSVVEQYKQKLDEALLQRDKAMLKQQQQQKLNQNLNSKHRDQIQTLKTSFEKIITSQTQKLRVLEDSRDDFESTFQQKQLSLKNQLQRIRRENNLLRQQNSKYINTLKTGSEGQIINKIKQLEDRNESLNKLLAQKQRHLRDQTQHKDEMIRNLENQNRDLSRQVDRQRGTARQAINERTQFKSKISIIQKQKQCLQEEVVRLKRAIDQKTTQNQQQREWRIRQLQQKLSDAILKEKTVKQHAVSLLQKYDEAEAQLKMEYQNRIQQLERQLQKMRAKSQPKSNKAH